MLTGAGRVRALIALCGIAVLLIASAASAAGSQSRGSLLVRCAKLMSGQGTPGERAVPGPADPQVAGDLSIFRATRTSLDMLPAASNLGEVLAGAQATTYDPSASVRLNLPGTKGGPVYAVPAMLATPR